MNPDRRPAGTVGLAGARQALAAGTAVVLPNPAPLTCVVAGTDPAAVNGAKHRPADQPVALWAHHPDTFADVADALDLDRPALARARHLLAGELLTLLVPLRPAARRPAWLAPASKDGWTLLFGARWQPLRPLLDAFPVLYVSSANRTGHPPAADTAEAVAVFGADTPVLALAEPAESAVGEPEAGEPPARRRATTTLRLHPDGRLTLHRHGAQDHPYPDAAAYLAHLRGTSG
ncbi:hypothetical protein KNE206_65090 [Kitasatospora sp. NE20-6]|uniref:Sua5/YciO/YrdC/YwlC family protein n=1 Tax=Kitasatospora sp. NE20-6 TaxID=2859066 RepID=UPI0034DC72CE